jgi:hypothetical protein
MEPPVPLIFEAKPPTAPKAQNSNNDGTKDILASALASHRFNMGHATDSESATESGWDSASIASAGSPIRAPAALKPVNNTVLSAPPPPSMPDWSVQAASPKQPDKDLFPPSPYEFETASSAPGSIQSLNAKPSDNVFSSTFGIFV